jgi:hypothetical protein
MNPDNIHQKSHSSAFFGGFSIILEISGLIMLFFGNWFFALSLITFGITISFIAFKKAGGKENSALYENKDLFELISYGVRCAQVKIGFHSSRDQAEIIQRLNDAGFRFKKEDIRGETRRLISTSRDAFDSCRNLIFIESFIDGSEIFCDGYGKKSNPRAFLESEIIINTSDATKSFRQALLALIQ